VITVDIPYRIVYTDSIRNKGDIPMMNKYEAEVLHIGGEVMLNLAKKEFVKGFIIVGGDPDRIILGDKEKNIAFSRGRVRVIERFVFNKSASLERKR